MYIGPRFIIQIRYAQVLSAIFVTFTYSSGLPMLYFITFLSLAVTYWTDKILVLRYFRKTEGISKDISHQFVKILPLCLILHFLFGLVIFSSPNLLKTEAIGSYPGNNTQYYNSKRIGQHHIVIFSAVSLCVLILIIFEW